MDPLTKLLIIRRRRLQLLLKLEKRREWIRPINSERATRGHFHSLIQELRLKDVEGFFNYFRMSPSTFDQLLGLIGPHIQKMNTNFRKALSPGERLSITIRYLASGDSMRSLAFNYRVGVSTVSTVVNQTTTELWNILKPIYLPEPNMDMWRKNSIEFEQLWNFPNCIGAIDGKHVRIQSPDGGGSLFYNYKNSHSIILLAVCDATYCYNIVDIGAYGKNNDASVFNQSAFGRALENGNIYIPEDKCLPNGNILLPHVFVADEAFPLKRHLLRPYPGKKLDKSKQLFNYRLSRARRVIENVFGITANRWRILRTTIIGSTETVENIVKATVCLHNFICRTEEQSSVFRKYYLNVDSVSNNIESASNFQEIGRLSTNTYSKDAAIIREKYKEYFEYNPLPWQDKVVNRGFTSK